MIFETPSRNINSEISSFFTILFVIMSFITQSIGESGVLLRLTPPDIMGGLAILFFILSGQWFRFDKFWYIVLFIITLLIGGIFGLAFEKSLIEVLILLFLFLIFMIIVSHFTSLQGLRKLIYYISIAAILASVFGIYDTTATIVGLPRIFPERAPGEVLSGFRNAGQAGAYFLVILSILIPIRSSQLISSFKNYERRIINIAVVFSLILFFLTGKIAAYIGFAVGLGGFFILQRSGRSLLVLLLVIISSIFVFQNLEKIAPSVANRIVGKYQTRIQKNISGESQLLSEDSFIGENIRDALTAFRDNPAFGSGIGGFTENYSQYEVHSTYFKIIGETGIFGILAYVIFMYNVFSLLKYRSRKTPLREFLFYFLPFFIGCLVSWSYTYHMRKREFWILMSVLVIVNTLIVRNMWITKWRINRLILDKKLKAHESPVV